MITAPLNFSEFDAAAQGSLQERYLSLAEIRELSAVVGNDSGIFQTIAIKAEQPNERRLERVVNAGLNLSGAHQAPDSGVRCAGWPAAQKFLRKASSEGLDE